MEHVILSRRSAAKNLKLRSRRSFAALRMTPVALVVLLACHREPAKPAQAHAPTPPPITNTAPVPKPMEAKRPKAPDMPPIDRALPAIAAAKTLKVLFTFNSTGYFIYRGETMGYEYDLLNQFAHDNGLRLAPVVAASCAATTSPSPRLSFSKSSLL